MKNPDNTQEKLRSIFRVAPTGIGFVKNRVFQEVNLRVCEMTGYSEDELIGQSSRILYPTEEEFNYVGSEKYDQIARQGTGIVETRWQRKDGSIINVLLASTPIDTSDLSQGVAFTALDFTERKQMQDALKESEKKYRLLVENQTDLLVKVDTEGRFIFVSPSYCSLFGKTEKELLGKKFMPLVHKDDRKATEEAMKSLYTPPYTAYIEQRAMTINGWQWIGWVDTAIRDVQGNIREIIGVGRVVTDRKIAEEKLEETKFGIDHAQIGVYQVEEDGTIKYANNYAAESLGYTTAELTGRSLFDIDSEFDLEKFKQHREETRMKSGKTIFSTHRRKDGTEFPVEVTVNYFKFRDKLLSFSFVKDISERKQAEKTLLESEARFRTMAETSPVGIVISDKKQRTVFVNERFKELFGYSVEQIPTVDDWYLLAYPDEHYREMVQKDWNREIIAQKRGQATGQLMEYSVTCSDGSVKQIEFRLISISDLNFIFFIDHTERYEAEAAIRESERKLSTLMDNQPGMAYRCRNDKNWTMEFVSSGCKEVTGYEANSLIGNRKISYNELIHPDDSLMVRKIIDDALEKKEKFIIEYRIKDQDGNERWVWEKGLGLEKKGGDYDYVEGFIMDVTDRKSSEIELLQLKEELEVQINDKTRELLERVNELERFHQATIDREFRIKELRDEIERLKGEKS